MSRLDQDLDRVDRGFDRGLEQGLERVGRHVLRLLPEAVGGLALIAVLLLLF